MDKDTNQIIEFLKEIDKLKAVDRVIQLPTLNRCETTAEHSWHLAMFIILFKDKLKEELNYEKMLEMALIHDLVEIYAGDTFAFDEKAREGKHEREEKAANKLFAILPKELENKFHKLFEEYENKTSKEAEIVFSFDKLHPLMQNLISNGADWKKHKLTFEIIDENKRPKIYNNEILKIYIKMLKEAKEKDLFYKE